MIVLNEPKIRKLVTLTREVIDVIGETFCSTDSRFSCQPPVQQMMLDPLNGLLCVKSFYSADNHHFVVKMAGNYRLGDKDVSQTQGMNALYDAKSGQLCAVLADNGYLTQIRTAAAGGYAVDQLAPEHINVATIVGTGRQARMQLSALLLVRQPKHIRCLGRNKQSLKSFSDWAEQTHHVKVTCYTEGNSGLTDADLVITTTTSRTPVIHRDAILAAGQHRDRLIVAMGSDSVDKRELEEALIMESDLWVCDDLNQSSTLGELKGLSKETIEQAIKPVTLDKIDKSTLSGLIICDLTGIAKLDLAISEYCLAKVSG